MTGLDYSQEEIDAYTQVILKSKKNGCPIPTTFTLKGKQIRTFRKGGYDVIVDATTHRLHHGFCTDHDSTDHGKPRWTLAKSNLADQNSAQEYLLRQFVSHPTMLATLQKNCSLKSGNQKKVFFSDVDKLLRARFELAPAKLFITEGAKGCWDLQYFFMYAQAYVDLFKNLHCSSDELSTEAAIIFKIQRQQELLDIIVSHCDKEFDNTSDKLEATKGEMETIKQRMKNLKTEHDFYYQQLLVVHDRIDEYGEDMQQVKAKIKEHDESLVYLKDKVDWLGAAVEQQMKLGPNSKNLIPERSNSLVAGQQQTSVGTNQHHDVQVDQKLNNWKNPILEPVNSLILKATAKDDSAIISHEVRGEDFRTLCRSKWLNDVIIKDFLRLLQKRDATLPRDQQGCYFFTPFFITKLMNRGHRDNPNTYQYSNVEKWTRRSKVDIFDCKKVFVPINQSLNHWILSVIDFEEQRIQLYDSYRKRIRPRPDLLNALFRYLDDEHKDKKARSLPDKNKWDLIDVQLNETPAQTNDDDCGVFLCMFAYFLSLGRPLEFTQDDITKHGRDFLRLSIVRDKVD